MAKNPAVDVGDQVARKQLIEQVAGMIVSLGAETGAFSSTSAELRSLAAVADGQAQTVAAASEQTSNVIDTVASAAQELSSSLQEVSRRTGDTSDAVQRAVVDAADAQTTMVSLDDSCKAIREVSKLIASVARQTNLLALNATIEAARAGEAGKGFAVVANEVKDLSRQTGEATEQIDKSVGVLTADAARVGRAIIEIADTVTRIGQMTIEVAAAVEEQTAVTAEIARSATEAAGSSGEVATAVSGVHSVIMGTGEHVARVDRLARRLKEEAAGLNKALQSYLKGEVREQKITGTSTADRLGSAVAAHGAWKARLMEAVFAGTSDVDVTAVALDDKCPLGVWLYKESSPEDRAVPHYEVIRGLHAQFHTLASAIMRHAEGAQRARAVEEVAFGGVFDALSGELVTAINAWRDEFDAENETAAAKVAPRR